VRTPIRVVDSALEARHTAIMLITAVTTQNALGPFRVKYLDATPGNDPRHVGGGERFQSDVRQKLSYFNHASRFKPKAERC
jgi:hypothetical protein